MTAIEPLQGSDGLKALLKHYDANMAQARGTRYFNLIKAYFSAYSEFSQVQFLVVKGLNISDNHRASSVNFDGTKMFYGNAFETFTSSVDLLAFLNNLLCARL